MKLEKAIEILTLMGTPEFVGHTEDILMARLLGIEALIVLRYMRNAEHPVPPELLPGETED